MMRLSKTGPHIGTFLKLSRYELKVTPIFTRLDKKFVNFSF